MAEVTYASNGKGNLGVVLGSIGTGLGLLGNGLGGMFGGWGRNGSMCSEDHLVNRFELDKDQTIARLETENSLLKANIYTDQKLADMYERLDGKIRVNEAAINQQAVYNATNNAMVGCIQAQVAQLTGMTKTVIPKSNICPEPMDRFNSWTAPAASATS